MKYLKKYIFCGIIKLKNLSLFAQVFFSEVQF